LLVPILHERRFVKRIVNAAIAAAALLAAGRATHVAHAADKLELHVSPAISMAPASVLVRATVQHNADNRELEIVADSSAFYRRSVVELDGEQAPKTTELRLIDIPGGEYEVRATLVTARGDQTTVRTSIMVVSHGVK
jgi:hypothetical protein